MLYEVITLGLIGVAVGFAFSMPLIAYFVKHPIPLPSEVAKSYETFGIEAALYFSGNSIIFIRQISIVFIITLIISLYPVLKALNLKLTKSLRA